MIVLDASAALELLLNTPLGPKIADQVFSAGVTLHAPHLIDLEIAQVLRRLLRKSEINEERASEVFQDLADLSITRYPHQLLLPAIWSLRENATAYDAAYLTLAAELGASLLTCDNALRSIPGHSAQVSVIQ